MSDPKMELALRTRTQVLGPVLAEKTLGKGAVSTPIHELVTVYGWGEAWQGRRTGASMVQSAAQVFKKGSAR